jgi:hypothetical protein
MEKKTYSYDIYIMNYEMSYYPTKKYKKKKTYKAGEM